MPRINTKYKENLSEGQIFILRVFCFGAPKLKAYFGARYFNSLAVMAFLLDAKEPQIQAHILKALTISSNGYGQTLIKRLMKGGHIEPIEVIRTTAINGRILNKAYVAYRVSKKGKATMKDILTIDWTQPSEQADVVDMPKYKRPYVKSGVYSKKKGQQAHAA